MDSRYLRNVPALSEEACALLQKKRVLIVGCGGIGGYLLELLLRIGVGTIRVCDGDVFENANLNRQILAEVSSIGTSKVQAAVLRGSRVNPNVVIEAFDLPMTKETVFDLLQDCDAVLDGLDNIEGRRILAHACSHAGIPYVFGAVHGWIAQAAISMPGDHLIDILYSEEVHMKDRSVLSFTPALCASVQAALCIQLLTGCPVETGKLYHLDLQNLEIEAISLS